MKRETAFLGGLVFMPFTIKRLQPVLSFAIFFLRALRATNYTILRSNNYNSICHSIRSLVF